MKHKTNFIAIQYLTRLIILTRACIDLAHSAGLL